MNPPKSPIKPLLLPVQPPPPSRTDAPPPPAEAPAVTIADTIKPSPSGATAAGIPRQGDGFVHGVSYPATASPPSRVNRGMWAQTSNRRELDEAYKTLLFRIQNAPTTKSLFHYTLNRGDPILDVAEFFLGLNSKKPKPLVLELDGITIIFERIGDVVHAAKILIEEYNLLKIDQNGYLEVTLGEKRPEESEELYLAERKMLTNITRLLNNLHLILLFHDVALTIEESYSESLLSDLIFRGAIWDKEIALAKQTGGLVPHKGDRRRAKLITIDPYNFKSMKQILNLPLEILDFIPDNMRGIVGKSLRIQGEFIQLTYLGDVFKLARQFYDGRVLRTDIDRQQSDNRHRAQSAGTGKVIPVSSVANERLTAYTNLVTFVLNHLALILQDEVLMRQGFILADGFNADDFDTRFYAAGRLNGLVMYKGWERPIKKR